MHIRCEGDADSGDNQVKANLASRMSASLGNLFNTGAGSEQNINVRAATLHVIGDLVQSAGVVVASALIWINPKWSIADPICTLLFALMVLMTTWGMLREILDILMERTPRGVDIKEVSDALWDVEGVVDVHCLHVWALTSGKYLASAHVQVEEGRNEQVLHEVETVLNNLVGTYVHTTIQVTARESCCSNASSDGRC